MCPLQDADWFQIEGQCSHAGATCVSPAALFAPSDFRPGRWAAIPIQRQAKWNQRSSLPLCCAHLHTTARAAFTPADTQSQPRASVSATSEPEDVEARRPAGLQQHSAAASQQGSQCDSEGDRGTGAVEGSRIVLYKGRYMLAFRMLVRFKIFQLVGIAALAVPINTFLAGVSLFICCPSPTPHDPVPHLRPQPNHYPMIVFSHS